MAVALDAVGPAGGAGQTTTTAASITWTHTLAGAGVVLAAVALGATTTTIDAFTCTATCGGTAMTSLGKMHANNATNGYVQLFGLTGVTSGAKTVVVTASGTPTSLAGGSVSYTGAGSFGTAVTAFGNSASASASVTGTATGNTVVGAFGGGAAFGAATTGTSRVLDNASGASGDGNLAMSDIASAAASVTLTRALTADFWGVVVVEVKASVATAAPPPPARVIRQAVTRSYTY